MRTDVVVLGAGIVGVSIAVHLQKRGRSVTLVDRRGAGEETSYGNTGIIQREGVVPYPFPRDIALMAQYALNLRPESNLHWSALPKIAPWLFRYWQASTPARLAASGRSDQDLSKENARLQEEQHTLICAAQRRSRGDERVEHRL